MKLFKVVIEAAYAKSLKEKKRVVEPPRVENCGGI